MMIMTQGPKTMPTRFSSLGVFVFMRTWDFWNVSTVVPIPLSLEMISVSISGVSMVFECRETQLASLLGGYLNCTVLIGRQSRCGCFRPSLFSRLISALLVPFARISASRSAPCRRTMMNPMLIARLFFVAYMYSPCWHHRPSNTSG